MQNAAVEASVSLGEAREDQEERSEERGGGASHHNKRVALPWLRVTGH